MRCPYSQATHAVIGIETPDPTSTNSNPSYGVLYWHHGELDAYREARRINSQGGRCRVVVAPGGNIQHYDLREVRSLIADAVATMQVDY